MEDIIKAFFTSFAGLLLILLPISNPIGMAPNFLFYTEAIHNESRRIVAKKVALLSFSFSVGILIAGPPLLRFFGIDVSFIRISGGLLLAISGWQILSSEGNSSSNYSDKNKDAHKKIKTLKDRIFFPIVFPVTVGSGSVAIIITMATDYFHGSFKAYIMVASYIGGAAALFVNAFLFYICYKYSREIFSHVGKTGTIVICKISAFILIAIGLQVAWGGFYNVIIELFKVLKSANLL
ncbi:MAG TPA: hypothetical protein DD381_08925 [Lentisphaeria bacterium]|nr:MAG: hypothetical protein A2X47_07925 [Lentisphaerae bacterium GWF2_38_69]HBM16445.1 hypothetical protein [Lentisphaeria bacterium]